MAFWITSRMKAKGEQVDEELVIIKLFTSNYARDLLIKKYMMEEKLRHS
jgi:hypothetical protein